MSVGYRKTFYLILHIHAGQIWRLCGSECICLYLMVCFCYMMANKKTSLSEEMRLMFVHFAASYTATLRGSRFSAVCYSVLYTTTLHSLFCLTVLCSDCHLVWTFTVLFTLGQRQRENSHPFRECFSGSSLLKYLIQRLLTVPENK